jgi:drug/metabolite transporter (DMT)-like permease
LSALAYPFAYPLALGAAGVFAVAALLEHRSAGQVPDAQGLAPRQLASFVRATLRHPWWLAGMGCNAVGFALHALALHTSALSVVQPLLVCGVLFALPLNHWLLGEPITASELGWAVALVAGLVGFLITGTAGVSASHEPADTGPAVAAGLLAVAVVGSLAATARRGGRGATLLGAATGIVYALTATLIKACTNVLVHGPVALLVSWQLYTLLVTGVVGLLLNQLSYQAGPLAASLPAITVVDPLLAVLLGVVIYDENLRHTPLAIACEFAFLGLLASAATALTRLQPSETAA